MVKCLTSSLGKHLGINENLQQDKNDNCLGKTATDHQLLGNFFFGNSDYRATPCSKINFQRLF